MCNVIVLRECFFIVIIIIITSIGYLLSRDYNSHRIIKSQLKVLCRVLHSFAEQTSVNRAWPSESVGGA